MEKYSPPITERVANKIKLNYRYLSRSRDKTIYHCCIQKSASQWFKKIFYDDLIWQTNKLALYSPSENFITTDAEILKKLNTLPKDVIVSPLYIRYTDFVEMPKPQNFRAFFIARDPRDIIISNYFSLKYSHDPYHPYILKMREKLNSISQDEGLNGIIRSFTPSIKKTLEGWFEQSSANIKLIKFEDIFGINQFEVFSKMLEHCQIDLNPEKIQQLLDKYSFENISGRKLGKEDVKHHFRKGTAGDWKNYFNNEQTELFKSLADDLLTTCGYEKDNDW